MVGLLNHLVCVLLLPYHVMYGVYGVLDAARIAGLGQDEPTPGVCTRAPPSRAGR